MNKNNFEKLNAVFFVRILVHSKQGRMIYLRL